MRNLTSGRDLIFRTVVRQMPASAMMLRPGSRSKCYAIEEVIVSGLWPYLHASRSRRRDHNGPTSIERCRPQVDIGVVEIIDRESAAEVDVSQFDAGFGVDTFERGDEFAEGFGVNSRIGILRTDVQVNAAEVEVRRIFVLAKRFKGLVGHHAEF